MINRHFAAVARSLAAMSVVTAIVLAVDVQTAFGEASEEAAGPVVEEIIVTARKRQESLLEIPESVAALSGDQIAPQSIDNLRDIGLSVPNLNLSMRTDGFPNVTIRGIGGFGNTQGVGFYYQDDGFLTDENPPRLFAASLSYRF